MNKGRMCSASRPRMRRFLLPCERGAAQAGLGGGDCGGVVVRAVGLALVGQVTRERRSGRECVALVAVL